MNPAPPEKTFTFPAPPPIPNDHTSHTDFATQNANGPPQTSHSMRDRSQRVTISEPPIHPSALPGNQSHNQNGSTPNRSNTKRSRRRATTKSSNRQFHATDADSMLDKEDAKRLLELVQGHIVLWPYDWLESEERGGGWLYNVDQIAPLEIYN